METTTTSDDDHLRDNLRTLIAAADFHGETHAQAFLQRILDGLDVALGEERPALH